MGKLTDLNLWIDSELVERFKKVAEENEATAKEVLTDFMKDYIVSSGHPEQVVNKWPWNRRK